MATGAIKGDDNVFGFVFVAVIFSVITNNGRFFSRPPGKDTDQAVTCCCCFRSGGFGGIDDRSSDKDEEHRNKNRRGEFHDKDGLC